MNRKELVAAMDAGLSVRWKNDGYQLYLDTSGQYLKTFEPNGYTIGVFHRDGIGMNVDPKDCYIKEECFAHSPNNCPSNHWNRGDDICEDCGLNLNE